MGRSMTKSLYPRVLIISGEPFNLKSATGITLSNLFRDWPKEKLAQIYSADIQPDLDVCAINWRISNNDLLLIKQARQLLGKKSSSLPSQRLPASTVVAKKNNVKVAILRQILVPLVDLLPYQLSEDMQRQVREFAPDVIYSLLGSVRIVRLVNDLTVRYSVPVVAHFMDDWLSTYSSSGASITTTIQRLILNRLTHQTMKRSTIGLSIGDLMAEEYSQRFGVPFTAFMNPVSLPSDDAQSRSLSKEEVTFIYVGGFHLGRYENLVEFGQAIANVRKQGIPAKLLIYAPSADIEQYSAGLRNDGVEICGTLAPQDVQTALLHADVAVHVESFLDKFSSYTRLSVSTKLPQYCAAALPILAYCPSQVASCRYVLDSQCGIAVGHNNLSILEAAIRDLASDPTLRQQLGRHALSVARERHDAIKERIRFRDVLAKAALEPT
jgi:glycosyltransferase involved in cell wall biosynthesis